MVTPLRLLGRRRLTLAGQFLLLQLAIVLLVLVAVAAVSLAQSSRTFEREEGRRMLSVAETLAATGLVRDRIDQGDPQVLAILAESARTTSGATTVALADATGRVVVSQDPDQVGQVLPRSETTVRQRRSWTGTTRIEGHAFLTAYVPVLSAGDDDPTRPPGKPPVGTLLGVVGVAQEYPSTLQRLQDAVPNLLTYLGVASALGVLGSWLLARRVKRQTQGLEPREIVGLVEHREAMLHGIKEGVIALDQHERVTLVNDVAVNLLELPGDAVGRSLRELGITGRLHDVLTGGATGEDLVVAGRQRVLVLNRMDVVSQGRVLGSVTTLRDRTELVALQQELGTTRTASETLRAQTHEFANILHVISGLIQLGEHDEVVRFVEALNRHRVQLDHDLTTRLADPALAALLVAKMSLAAERGVALRVTQSSRLPRVDPELSADLTTVVGNLVDNALDAVGAEDGGWVEVDLHTEGSQLLVEVRDSGPGVPPERIGHVFDQGFTTKSGSDAGSRGFGLALVRVVVTRRGGSVGVHNGDEAGAVFTARVPLGPSTPTESKDTVESAR